MLVKDYCEKISRLMESVGEIEWANLFQDFAQELDGSNDVNVYRKILRLYGGMGSFNDLVLQKNGSVLGSNSVLIQLRHGLYNEIEFNWK